MSTVAALENSTRLYVILDIPNFSNAEQIRAAYKAMALRYHPDKNIGDPSAVDRFREVQVAYEILSDETRRRRYDVALRMATRDGGGYRAASDNPYMRGMGTTTTSATGGTNVNANIYDELNRYAARATKARTASAARTGVGRGAGAAGAGGAAYASADHTTSQYSRAQQEEFRRRERERNAEMKRQREKERRDQRDRDREALRKEQARQEEMLQQHWQQQQKAFASAPPTRTRAAPAASGGPATPRTGRGARSKTPPPSAPGADDVSATPERMHGEAGSTPPPDTVPLRRSRPASVAPGQPQTRLRGASSRGLAAEDDESQPFSPRPVHPGTSSNSEGFCQTTSGTSEGASKDGAPGPAMTARRAHTPGRPATPRTARNGINTAAAGGKLRTDSPSTPRPGAAGGRPGGTPVRANPLSNEDKALLGRQRSERAKQRGKTANASVTPVPTMASTTSSASVSPQPSMPREDVEPPGATRPLRTRQRAERERSVKDNTPQVPTETVEQRLGYLVDDEAAEREQLIEREEALARQRMLRTYHTEYQRARLTAPEFTAIIRAEASERATLETAMHRSRELHMFRYNETMDRLHVTSLEAAVRRRLYGRRAADAYHVHRSQSLREALCHEETRLRTSIRYQEAKHATWMLEVMGPEFFARCLLQEAEANGRRRIALQELKADYVKQSPPRRSPSAVPADSNDPLPTFTHTPSSPRGSCAAAASSVPDVVVAARRVSATSVTDSGAGPLSMPRLSHSFEDLDATSMDVPLVVEEAQIRQALEQQEGRDMRALLRRRANGAHALYEADKAIVLEAAQHAFDVQLRALRSEVARLQQQTRRSATPSYASDHEEAGSTSTSRLFGHQSPDSSRRRSSLGSTAIHAPSPVRPTLTPPAANTPPPHTSPPSPGTGVGGLSPLSPATTQPTPVVNVGIGNANSPTHSSGAHVSPSSSSTSAPPSTTYARGSAVGQHYLSTGGPRAAPSNGIASHRQGATLRRSAAPLGSSGATATTRSGSREGQTRSSSRDGVAAKPMKVASSPVRKQL